MVTLRDLRFAEASRDQAAEAVGHFWTSEHLALLYEAVMHLHQVRSKWQKRRKAGRAS